MAPIPRRKLEPSQLAKQLELIENDLDVDGIKLVTRGRTFAFSESIVGGEINRTIEGASTVNLTVTDFHKKIRNSGMLGAEVDINVDGLWFRLVAVNKSGNELQLTFESREVAILRTYNNLRVTGWGKMSRTRFVQILMNESPQTRLIPFICPELIKDKKIVSEDDRLINREYGFGARKAKGAASVRNADNSRKDALPIKRTPATPEQQQNIQTVLDVGVNMIPVVNKHQRKILVASIMTIIQESTCRNLPRGRPGAYNYLSSLETDNPIGIFQQRETIGGERSSWPATGDVALDAEGFFRVAVQNDANNRNYTYENLAESVQRSGNANAYGQWRNEAERWVTAYGVAGGDATDDAAVADTNLQYQVEPSAVEFQFQRGRVETLEGGRKHITKETTWDCMNRLAQEVNWRAFETSGAVYFISEPKLFKSAPRARISEASEGVDWIDFSYDVGKTNSTITITGRANRWAAPPGTCIEVFDNGPVNGRWLVTEIRRSIFSPDVTITCKKPRAKFPEPTQASDTGGLLDNVWVGDPTADTRTPTRTPSQQGYPTGKQLRDAVLNHPGIKFKSATQSQDVIQNNIDERVLTFLVGFADAGFTAVISSLKTGHSL